MALIDLKNIRLSFGGPPLLDGIDLVIDPGERVCLLGPNGEGKASLIKIMHGELQPGSGTIQCKQGLRVGFLEQEVPGGMPGRFLMWLPGASACWANCFPITTS